MCVYCGQTDRTFGVTLYCRHGVQLRVVKRTGQYIPLFIDKTYADCGLHIFCVRCAETCHRLGVSPVEDEAKQAGAAQHVADARVDEITNCSIKHTAKSSIRRPFVLPVVRAQA